MKKIGFIGAGNMAEAIMRGATKNGFLSASEIIAYDVDADKCMEIKKKYGISIACDNIALVHEAEMIVVAIKPIFVKDVLQEIAPHFSYKKLISIAAGWTNQMLKNALSTVSNLQMLRVMPNTPALVGAGFTALCEENSFDEADISWTKKLFNTFGQAEMFPERLFDAVIAVSGSSPAYVFMLIEAMADGAVKLGMPRTNAYNAAAQAVLGAAKMVLETGEHPGRLKDNVCSPGGTTIEAVHALEQGGLRAAIMDAMDICAQKSRAMAQD